MAGNTNMIARVCVCILSAAIAPYGDKLAKTALAYSNIDLAFEQYTLTISDSNDSAISCLSEKSLCLAFLL